MADAQAQLDAPLKKTGNEFIEIELGETKEKVKPNSAEHRVLTMEFDTMRKYKFELAVEADKELHPVVETSNAGRTNILLKPKRFKPNHNIILSSQIVWNGQRRNIRYYAGCTTLFTDKQPQDKAVIDQAISGTPKYRFIDGKISIDGYEKMWLLYMMMCSWNVDSPFRTRTADGVFKTVDAEKIADEATSEIDLMEKALQFAREASKTKMLIHANYLGIPDTDWDNGNLLTEKEIRAEYRKFASANAKYFVETYSDASIEIKHFIKDALGKGTIRTNVIQGKATWGSKNSEICGIEGLKSQEAIEQRLYEFSQLDDGVDFQIQLKQLYSKN